MLFAKLFDVAQLIGITFSITMMQKQHHKRIVTVVYLILLSRDVFSLNGFLLDRPMMVHINLEAKSKTVQVAFTKEIEKVLLKNVDLQNCLQHLFSCYQKFFADRNMNRKSSKCRIIKEMLKWLA